MRKVATLEGQRFYGVPIGTPITADIHDLAVQKSGGKPAPKGASRMLRTTSRLAPQKPMNLPKPAPKAPAAPPAPPAPKKLKLSEPSIKGPLHFTVGKAVHSAPKNSTIVSRKDNPGVRYVLTNNRVHVLHENGEVKLDKDHEKQLLAALQSSPKDFVKVHPSETPQHAKAQAARVESATRSGAHPDTAVPGKPIKDPRSMGHTVLPPDSKETDAMKVSPYTAPHLDEHGNLTPERMALHDQIINSFLDGLQPSSHPIQYMNGGGPASGKGTMTKGANARLTNYPTARTVDDETGQFNPMEGDPQALLIDPDAIKQQFPEVQAALRRLRNGGDHPEDKGWAGNSHEESSQLAKRLHRAALERGYNVIYDGTGNGSAESVISKVQAAKDLGYEVHANYLYLDPKEGIARAASRAEHSHRVVPLGQITGTYEKLPGIFHQIKDAGLFDKVNLFDNNVAKGEPSKLIGTGDGKSFHILDPESYGKYLQSGGVVRDTAKPEKAAGAAKDVKTTVKNGGIYTESTLGGGQAAPPVA